MSETARAGASAPRSLPHGRRLHPLVALALRRVLVGLALAVVVSLFVFVATNVLPGDAASAMLGKEATPEAITAVRRDLGLDKPLTEQYLDWIGGFVQGDLGESFAARQPVTFLLEGRLANTLTLALVTTLVMFPLSILLGVLAGLRPGRLLDHSISLTTLAMIAVPEFIVGTLLALVFAVSFDLLPAISLIEPGRSPLATPEVLVLPVATLCAVACAYAIRMVRAGVIDVMSSDFVQMARLQGIVERRVVVEYALRNSLAPTVQVLALTLQWLVGGVIVVETVFAYPGLGALLVEAMVTRDLPLVQSLAMLIALAYIAINIVADLLVIVLIPKVRTSQ